MTSQSHSRLKTKTLIWNRLPAIYTFKLKQIRNSQTDVNTGTLRKTRHRSVFDVNTDALREKRHRRQQPIRMPILRLISPLFLPVALAAADRNYQVCIYVNKNYTFIQPYSMSSFLTLVFMFAETEKELPSRTITTARFLSQVTHSRLRNTYFHKQLDLKSLFTRRKLNT